MKKRSVLTLMLVISLVVTACGGKSGKKAGHDSKEGDVAVEILPFSLLRDNHPNFEL